MEIVLCLIFSLLLSIHAQQCNRYVTLCDDDGTLSANSQNNKGVKGDRGYPGKSGAKGEGTIGPQGERGRKGEKGEATELGAFMQEVRDRLAKLEAQTYPNSCSTESSTNGKVTLFSTNDAYCEDGWRVIQRRIDGSVDFYRDWNEYKLGFGNTSGEFWMGLDNMHYLTRSGRCRLRIDLWDFSDVHRYAEYSTFQVNDEHDLYRLVVGGYNGTAGDSMEYHNNQPFTTKDRDNDDSSSNCAVSYHGAWWHKSCFFSSLNAKWGVLVKTASNIQWWHWKGHDEAVKATKMKILCN